MRIAGLRTLLLIGALATPTVSVATSAFADQSAQQLRSAALASARPSG
jgi:hypothetical protein